MDGVDLRLEDFIAMYADACGAAGVEPLPEDDLAVIANAVLTGSLPAFMTVH